MDSLDTTATSADNSSSMTAFVDDVLLPDTSEKEESNFDSHSVFLLEPDCTRSSSPEPESERERLGGGARSTERTTTSMLSLVSCL